MTEKERDLVWRDLNGRIPYDVIGTVPITFVDYKHCDMEGFYWDYEEEVDATLVSMTSDGVIYVHAAEPELYDQVMYEQEAGEFTVEHFKPYLRRISDLTDEEIEEIDAIGGWEVDRLEGNQIRGNVSMEDAATLINFFNAHHIDYNHLIEKGLAYPVDSNKNPYKKGESEAE